MFDKNVYNYFYMWILVTEVAVLVRTQTEDNV